MLHLQVLDNFLSGRHHAGPWMTLPIISWLDICDPTVVQVGDIIFFYIIIIKGQNSRILGLNPPSSGFKLLVSPNKVLSLSKSQFLSCKVRYCLSCRHLEKAWEAWGLADTADVTLVGHGHWQGPSCYLERSLRLFKPWVPGPSWYISCIVFFLSSIISLWDHSVLLLSSFFTFEQSLF